MYIYHRDNHYIMDQRYCNYLVKGIIKLIKHMEKGRKMKIPELYEHKNLYSHWRFSIKKGI